MTARNSSDSQPTAFEYSEFFNRLIGILTAGWMKATKLMRKNFRQNSMVKRQSFLVESDGK
jgi:hypothetical protein